MNKELEGLLVVIAEPGTTAAKIQSRLLSSKFLSIQVAASLEALKVLLNLAPKQNEPDNNTSSDKGIERLPKLPKETLNKTADEDMEGWESGSINEVGVEEPDDEWESADIGPNDTPSSKKESTFLSSLSVGFIRGGSDDSDWSETEDKGTDLEPKKNRRGQRARRA